MPRAIRSAIIILGLLAILTGGVWWSESSKASPAGYLLVAGNVRPETRTVAVPVIPYPTPDYTVGIPRPTGATGAMGASSQKRGAPSARDGQPIVAGMLESVLVREGDSVKSGQLVAQFDTKMLTLGVKQAATAARKARADVAVIGGNIDDLASAKRKLATARSKIANAKTTLAKANSTLKKARKQLLAQQRKLLAAKAQRPQLKAALAGLRAKAATFPKGKVPAALKGQIAQLNSALAAIGPGLKAIAKGLATIDAGLAKVDEGASALPKASARISSAAHELADAKTRLRTAKEVLGIVADGQDIVVKLAKARRTLATVRTPVAGIVTFARRGGTVAMVGAPLVRIRPDGPQRVDTYLTAEQVGTVDVGSEAEITYDSAAGKVLHGRISEIGSAYVFPPTSFSTQIVHMTRTLKVTILLDEGETAPAGTPVDISIHTNSNRQGRQAEQER